MCDRCDDTKTRDAVTSTERRQLLLAGAGLAAAPLVAGITTPAQAQQSVTPTRPFAVRAYGVNAAKGPFASIQIQRRPVGPKDVLIDILYCGICHSDIHAINGDWGSTSFPRVPGREIIGRVAGVGNAVTKSRVGDIAGVGCMVDSCAANAKIAAPTASRIASRRRPSPMMRRTGSPTV